MAASREGRGVQLWCVPQSPLSPEWWLCLVAYKILLSAPTLASVHSQSPSLSQSFNRGLAMMCSPAPQENPSSPSPPAFPVPDPGQAPLLAAQQSQPLPHPGPSSHSTCTATPADFQAVLHRSLLSLAVKSQVLAPMVSQLS